MALEILTTKSFEQALKRHPHPHIVYQKIQLLAENPYHPSLKGHRLYQIKDKNVWDAYGCHPELCVKVSITKQAEMQSQLP
ncbi:MAG: hypothetical protein NVSMB54_36510 [Ktedonobacteraceae bacterium]